MSVDETANLNVIVKLSGDDAATKRFNALVDKFKDGKMSINEFTEAIRIGTKVYNNWDDANEKLKPGLASTIKLMKDGKSQAVDPLTSAQGKLMKSYFGLGQEMRQWFVQQRVGDRLMRESAQTAGMLGNLLGAGGISTALTTATGAFQQFEYASVFAGKSMEKMGGQLKGLGSTLVGAAGGIGAVVAVVTVFMMALDKAKEIQKAWDEALKENLNIRRSIGLIGDREYSVMLAQQAIIVQRKEIEPSLWAAIISWQTMYLDYATKVVEKDNERLKIQGELLKMHNQVAAERNKAFVEGVTTEAKFYDLQATTAKVKADQISGFLEKGMENLRIEEWQAMNAARRQFGATEYFEKAKQEVREQFEIKRSALIDEAVKKDMEQQFAQRQNFLEWREWVKERTAFYQKDYNLTGKMNQQFLPTIQPGGGGAGIGLPGKSLTSLMGEGRERAKGASKESVFEQKMGSAQIAVNQLGESMNTSFQEATDYLAQGFAQAFGLGNSLLDRMISTFATSALMALPGMIANMLTGNIFTALFAMLGSGGDVVPGGGSLSFAAAGGDFKYGGNQNVIVGERGPELMQVGRNGVRIHSNDKLNEIGQAGRYSGASASQQPIVLETRIRGNDIVLVQAKANLSRNGRTM